jgi:hypothetical protein
MALYQVPSNSPTGGRGSLAGLCWHRSRAGGPCTVGAPTRATQLRIPGCQQHCLSAVPWNMPSLTEALNQRNNKKPK